MKKSNYKILMVDDNTDNIKLLGSILKEEDFLLGFATDGEQALRLMIEANDFDLVLLDVNMPKMNGYEVCRRMKGNEFLKDIPVIFLSAHSDVDFIVEGFESGANDYVTKPIKKRELLARINIQLKLKNAENSLKVSLNINEKLLVSEQQLLDRTLKGSIKMLIDILSMISPIDLLPSKRMTLNSRIFAKKLKIKNIWELDIALLLSKLGCITIPSEILDAKFKGKKLLANQEQIFMEHPKLGKKLISNIPRFDKISEAIEYQYKYFDGTGYPMNSIRAKNIPLIARILVLLNDIEELNTIGNSRKENLTIIQSRKNLYDPELLKIVDIEMFEEEEEETKESNETKKSKNVVQKNYDINKSSKNSESYSIGIENLKNGMTLAEDVRNRNGMILVYKNKEITEVIRHSLIHFSQAGTIGDLVKIYG